MPSCPPGSLTVDAALRVVLANAPLLEAEERAAFDAMGATLAEPVVDLHPTPPAGGRRRSRGDGAQVHIFWGIGGVGILGYRVGWGNSPYPGV